MQTNLEQAIEMIKMLPPEDFRRLDEWIREQKLQEKQARQKKQKLEAEIAKFKRAEKWLEENRKKYMNQWVCLEGEKLIAHGKDALEVDRQAREAGIEAPFLEHIIEEKYPFGGW